MASWTCPNKVSITQPRNSATVGRLPDRSADLSRPLTCVGWAGRKFVCSEAPSMPIANPSRLPGSEASRKSRGTNPASQREAGPPELRGAEHRQEGPQRDGEAMGTGQRAPCGFQGASILDPGGTGRLTAAASQAVLQVDGEGRIDDSRVAAFEGLHQHDSSARAVVLIAGCQIGRARGQAKAAMHAWVERADRASHPEPLPARRASMREGRTFSATAKRGRRPPPGRLRNARHADGLSRAPARASPGFRVPQPGGAG